MHSSIIKERSEKKNLFFTELKRLYESHLEIIDQESIDDQFSKVMKLLEYFEIDMLPYSAASKFIYEINDDDVEYFFQFFKDSLSTKLSNNEINEADLSKGLKLIEHLELANSQKAYLFNQQEEKLIEITNSLKEFDNVLSQYNKSKAEIEEKLKDFEKVSKQIDSLNKEMKKFKGVEEKFERIEKSTEQITTNLITILGIFASILLGAYGSINGFSSIFQNANNLGIGKILMLSSVGASAILLILFFLLSSVARLTGKQFGHDEIDFINRHPIMFFGHCILLIIFTTGGVMEIIQNNITIEKTGFGYY